MPSFVVDVRPLSTNDLRWALALNNDAVPAVNEHDQESLRTLIRAATHAWVANIERERAGILVSFGPGADYRSTNYQWLSERFDKFLYVDRIIVSVPCRGHGVGRRLYAQLEAAARAARVPRLVCEVNIAPPNPRSLGFHSAMGWTALEDRAITSDKMVRYFEKRMDGR